MLRVIKKIFGSPCYEFSLLKKKMIISRYDLCFLYIWYIPSEKNRSKFLIPRKCFFGYSFSILDLWPLLPPARTPGGAWGARGGPRDQKLQLFVVPHFGSKMLNSGLYELKALCFPGFWPLRRPKMAFF